MSYDPIKALVEVADHTGDAEMKERIAKAILPYVYSKQPSEVMPIGDGEGDESKSLTFTVKL